MVEGECGEGESGRRESVVEGRGESVVKGRVVEGEC